MPDARLLPVTDRADAHIHLFEGGYRGELLANLPSTRIDEVAHYESLMRQHDIRQALVVGYEGEPWCATNNLFLASLIAQSRRPWIRPAAYFDPKELSVDALESWRSRGFVGVSLYLFTDASAAALDSVPQPVWTWLADHRWLVTVNSRGAWWSAWQSVLAKNPEIRLIASHLGQPPAQGAPITLDQARWNMADTLRLSEHPQVCIKLSGLYALSDPAYDYPHAAAWPYIQIVLEFFGADRVVWGSDYIPALTWLSFPQTIGVLDHLPFLDAISREKIVGGNLNHLLDAVG